MKEDHFTTTSSNEYDAEDIIYEDHDTHNLRPEPSKEYTVDTKTSMIHVGDFSLGGDKSVKKDTYLVNDTEIDEETNLDEESISSVYDDRKIEEKNRTRNCVENSESPGQMCCYFKPNPVVDIRDFFLRSKLWLYANNGQIMSALTVSIVQIPEVISSAMIVGINPTFALQGTWIMNIITSIIGGSPGMISGSTTFVAIVLSELREKEGASYMFYAVMFGGLLQIVLALLGIGTLVRLIPNPVVQGFRNAMGLVIVAAQFRFGKVLTDGVDSPEPSNRNLMIKIGYSWEHIVDSEGQWNTGTSLLFLIIHVIIASSISFVVPKMTKRIPGPLVAIVLCGIIEHCLIRQISKNESATVGDYAMIHTQYVRPIWLDSSINLPPFSWGTFKKIYLSGLAVCGSGLAESILSLQVLNLFTGDYGLRNRVVFGQGLANIISSMFGGIGGSASISQSILANQSGGTTRLSICISGILMLIGIYYAHVAIELVPLGSIAGVMIFVAIKLFDWHSILSIIAAVLPMRVRDCFKLDCKITRADTLIILLVTGLTASLNLAVAILSGIVISLIVYAWDSSNRVVVERETSSEDPDSVTYNVSGPLFFATAQSFVEIFTEEDICSDPSEVIILLEAAEIFDSSGMVAVKRVYKRFVAAGKVVALSNLSPTTRRLMEKNAYMWQGVNFLEVEEIEDDYRKFQNDLDEGTASESL
mmetsp:Transcript_16513/g.23477  ORF Transcript_16513/g.23477 Transcript_16513/m.23477 type:complete len:702 (-) Transcript_16513:103-2208(-)|eukprot:CAMPEP_0184858428 /NCGR_PEP_ID=MMETSP0580-20130426/3520_1 /TAXON_ID=1118495 /ORGANISM="Dactyliosolen fragilissimus" /LENGTH=701 /DNA_ID=CAMNT_0027354561 /DNA_START=156 /DNA_END=2261 /DNA_ORIENTATION=+